MLEVGSAAISPHGVQSAPSSQVAPPTLIISSSALVAARPHPNRRVPFQQPAERRVAGRRAARPRTGVWRTRLNGVGDHAIFRDDRPSMLVGARPIVVTTQEVRPTALTGSGRERSMRHARIVVTHYGGPEAHRVVEEECPEPKDGEARVRVLAAGVSLPDLMMREGIHP